MNAANGDTMETRDEAREIDELLDEQDELRERRYRDILNSANKLHDAVDEGPGFTRYDYWIMEIARAETPERLDWAADQFQELLREAAERAAK